MKRYFYLTLLSLAALLAAGCAKESVQSVDSEGEAVYTFTLTQSGSASTKSSFSDGTTANYLMYGVYNSSGSIVDALSVTGQPEEETFTDGSLTTEVTIALAKGNSYTIAFWAVADDNPYTVSFADGTISYNEETALTSNVEAYDAFYAVYETGEVSGGQSVSVTLNRPFAQLNFGTDDLEEYYSAAETETLLTKVEVTGGYSGINFLSGEGISTDETLSFDYATVPSGEEFPYSSTDYDYVSMNYLFTDSASSTVDVVLYLSTDGDDENAQTVEVSAAPIQRNYRTNVYGSLLTGTYSITVTKDEEYDGSESQEYITVSTASELITALEDDSSSYIQISDDITLETDIVTVSSEKTLDLSGNTLYAESTGTRNIQVASGGSLTVTDSGSDGEVSNEGSGTSYGLFDVYGTLIIDSGTYKSVATGDGALIKGRSGGTVIINGGDFYTEDDEDADANASWKGNCIIYATSCKVSISSGTTFTSTGDCRGTIILEDCTDLDGNAVTLDGITITSEATVGIELCATDAVLSDMNIVVEKDGDPDYYGTAVAISFDSDVTIDSGTYTAPYAVYIYSSGGDCTINGGTFTGTSAVLRADVTSSYANSSNFYVTDGYFTGVYSISTTTGTDSDGNTYSASLSISGGYFSEDPSDWLAEGYEKADTDDSNYPYTVNEQS